jgi:hypothetical protein
MPEKAPRMLSKLPIQPLDIQPNSAVVSEARPKESRLVQMKIRVPAGKSVPLLNAFGPCWITYDSSMQPGMKWLTHYGNDENIAPVILDALSSGAAVLEYLTPGLGSPAERVAKAAGCEHPVHQDSHPWPSPR